MKAVLFLVRKTFRYLERSSIYICGLECPSREGNAFIRKGAEKLIKNDEKTVLSWHEEAKEGPSGDVQILYGYYNTLVIPNLFSVFCCVKSFYRAQGNPRVFSNISFVVNIIVLWPHVCIIRQQVLNCCCLRGRSVRNFSVVLEFPTRLTGNGTESTGSRLTLLESGANCCSIWNGWFWARAVKFSGKIRPVIGVDKRRPRANKNASVNPAPKINRRRPAPTK